MKELLLDNSTRSLFGGLRGVEIESLIATRYQGLAYSKVYLVTASSKVLEIVASGEEISAKFEVFRLSARESTLGATARADMFRFSGFVVNEVFIARREEWLEDYTGDAELVGSNPRVQHQGYPGSAPADAESCVAEYGIVLRGAGGDSLYVFADDFPLVLGLRIERSTKSLFNSATGVELVPVLPGGDSHENPVTS